MGAIKFIFLVSNLLCGFHQFTNSLNLASNGGYNIVVAIDENTPVPDIGERTYLVNIKNNIQVLSTQLWKTTNGRFFIDSVDLVIPSTWNATPLNGDALTQSYTTADIRISNTTSYPYAENLHPCGKPGEFIGLPLSFFQNANSDISYGTTWKALLNLWARFRWGVWDEHGYAGDSEISKRFPYVYRQLITRKWVPTGCSNEELTGQFVKLADNDVVCQSDNPLTAPEPDCRFKPNTNNSATTSLMHFHWLDSVDSFCDETNHNSLAPNKQNIYCDHKSIWEVIRTTPDYMAVTEPVVNVPILTFNTVRNSAKPLLYLLLDRGSIEGSLSIANKIPVGLIPLFTRANTQNNIAAIGSFPGNLSSGSYIQEEVGWSTIGSKQDEFLQALGHLEIGGPSKRDWGLAIKEVAEKIKVKNPAHGAVILVVKYGSGSANDGSFADLTPEAEVIATLKQQNIIVSTLELPVTGKKLTGHLVNVARDTNGVYSVLESEGAAVQAISSVTNFVIARMQDQDKDILTNMNTLARRRTNSNDNTIIPIPTGIRSGLQIYYTTSLTNLTTENFALTQSGMANNVSFRLRQHSEWNEEEDNGRKRVYLLDVHISALAIPAVQLRVNCPVNVPAPQCTGNILAIADFQPTEVPVEIMVSTSAMGSNAVDLNGQAQPFAIFAKVTKNGRSIEDIIVTAIVTQVNTNVVHTVNLEDNGLGGPDVEKDDGVYSAYFIPNADDSYKIAVHVQKNTAASTSTSKVSTTGLARLLPVDQEDFGCGGGNCEKETITGTYAQHVDYPAFIAFTGTNSFTAQPSKVTDLSYDESPTSGYLRWSSPYIPGKQDTVSAYNISKSSTLEGLLNNFDTAELVATIHPSVRPGNTVSTSIPKPDETTYYAIKPYFYSQPGAVSNIIRVERNPDDEVTTPPSTPPSTPSTSTPPSTPTTNTPPSTTTIASTTTTTTPPGPGITTPSKAPSLNLIGSTTGFITVIAIVHKLWMM